MEIRLITKISHNKNQESCLERKGLSSKRVHERRRQMNSNGKRERGRKEKAKTMKCPSCNTKVSIDLKRKECSCHQCGWRKNLSK
jgi:hypothetical protein